MKNYKKYTPYIRRMKKGDYSPDLFEAARMGIYPKLGHQVYVLVQRGFSHRVVMVGSSKQAIKNRLLRPWGEWRRWLKKYAQNNVKRS